jgi:hypothetical protein
MPNIIFCTKDNLEEATSWELPSEVIDKIRNTGKSNRALLIFQHISWIPKEAQEIHNNRGFIVTGGWNHSFHDCAHNSCIVSFEVGKRAGRIGRTRNNFKRAMEIAGEERRDKQTVRFFSRQMVRPGD